MILVADCSALIALASCNGLRWLEALFATVIVPEAVYREAVVSNKPEAQQLKEFLKAKVRKIDPSSTVLLDGFSDLGETEAMVLYKQCSADTVCFLPQYAGGCSGLLCGSLRRTITCTKTLRRPGEWTRLRTPKRAAS